MESLDKEISELKVFIADLKADRVSQKEKEKRESWTKYTSMSIVFIAVFAAVATQWAGKYSSRTLTSLNDATYHQALATDKWGQYQADSIKRNLYEVVHDLSTNVAAVGVDADKREKVFTAKVKKYQDDQDKVKADADNETSLSGQALDTARNSSAHGGRMGNVTSIFQISIAMGSICLVAKKKWLWYVSLALAAIATGQMVMVWLH
ncbi:MAG TPA: DUF4337 family protein [Verrucomicrobiae bacterium]|jgi:hypothetical protein|nr:DUF4337 family protein [Verrucomicrobiae bacterium]